MGLRESNRVRLRENVRREAIALFTQAGFDAVTVEQIAAATGISTATFYRHFPTKIDVLFSDEYDPFLADAFARHYADERLQEVVLAVYEEFADKIISGDHEALLARHRLMSSTPALQERLLVEQCVNRDALAECLARRTGRARGDYDIELAATLVDAAFATAARHWLDNDCRPRLAELVATALDRVRGVLDF